MNCIEVFARSGLGSLCNVACTLGNDPDYMGEINQCMHEAARGLMHFEPTESWSHMRRCIACAALNRDFMETGKLYSVSTDGKIKIEEHSDSISRTAIAKLLELS